MKKFLVALFLLFALSHPVFAAEKPLQIVATFSILGDMVKTIGGEDVLVTTLVGPDSDMHAFTPSPEDAKAITKADLIVMNGLGFEGWMQRLLEATKTKAAVVVASDGVKPRVMSEDGQTQTDPHAWQDLQNGRIYVRNIEAFLEKARPDKTGAFRARAKAYDVKIAQADKDVRAQLSSIPASKRKVITSHDAFGYFGAAYGVTFLSPYGLSSEAEPSAADIAKLARQIKSEGVKQVFIENMTNPKLIEQIGKDSGATLGGTLYSDALSETSGPAPTYLAMFTNNVPKLKASMELISR